MQFAEPDRVPAGGRYPAGTFLRGGTMAGTIEPADATPTGSDGSVTAAELAASIKRVTGIAAPIVDLQEPRRISDHARQVTTYRLGRVLLAGDAAHVHSPSGGQGLNLGLLDAANLGWKLGAVVRGDLAEPLLDTFTRERHPAGAAVLRNTRAQSALLAPGPHVDALREIVGELMDIPAANRYFSDLLSAVNLRYELPYPTDGLPELTGRHCPDLELVDGGGQASRLHAHTRTGRGLLLLPLELRDLAHCAAGRVELVAISKIGRDDVSALLLRPDGIVAWAAEPGRPADGATLDVALPTWFGEV